MCCNAVDFCYAFLMHSSPYRWIAVNEEPPRTKHSLNTSDFALEMEHVTATGNFRKLFHRIRATVRLKQL